MTLAGGIVFLWSSTDWPLALRLLLTLLGFAAITWCFLFPVRSFLRASGVRPDQARTLVLRMLLAAALAAVPLLGTWAGVMWVYNWVDVLTGRAIPDARPVVQMAVSLGASIGGVIGAVLGWHLGRRAGYAILCLAAAVSMLAFFRLNTGYGWELVCSAGVRGCAAGAFYGWLPLYLPELFPTDMRASGQGFGFNFGRIIAAIGTVQVGNLLAAFDNDYARACSLVAGVYIVGLGLALLVREHKFEG